MPTRKRPGRRTLYVEVPAALGKAFANFARAQRRTLTAEITLALERHLEAHGIKVKATPARGPGRPRKAK